MDPGVKQKFDSYPDHIRESMIRIRNAMFEVAAENDISEVEETLKWGEPSYLVKGGSTVRMDWKQKSPDQYAVYFHCQTTLVETFKKIYGGLFNYEGNRAIVFHETEDIPMEALKHCILLAFQYHKIKHLPMLGV